eukprot:2758067-Rhodomonas_salina.1
MASGGPSNAALEPADDSRGVELLVGVRELDDHLDRRRSCSWRARGHVGPREPRAARACETFGGVGARCVHVAVVVRRRRALVLVGARGPVGAREHRVARTREAARRVGAGCLSLYSVLRSSHRLALARIRASKPGNGSTSSNEQVRKVQGAAEGERKVAE